MADPQWVQCRLRRVTLEKLREWSRDCVKEKRYTVTSEEFLHRQQDMGIDICVAILLNRDLLHRQRGRKKKKK